MRGQAERRPGGPARQPQRGSERATASEPAQRYVPGRSVWSGTVGAGPRRTGAGRRSRRQLADLLELLASGELLGEQRGLDAVEQALQPPDELRLGDADLALGGHLTVTERQGEHLQLVLQIR